MKRTLLVATLASLLWGMPALAGPALDSDLDGLFDYEDNCINVANPAQDDTDGDGCGNLCDADYDQSGTVGFPDFGGFTSVFNTTGNEGKCHVAPIPGCTVGFPDFGFFTSNFNAPPGPSGTTAGTTACP